MSVPNDECQFTNLVRSKLNISLDDEESYLIVYNTWLDIKELFAYCNSKESKISAWRSAHVYVLDMINSLFEGMSKSEAFSKAWDIIDAQTEKVDKKTLKWISEAIELSGGKNPRLYDNHIVWDGKIMKSDVLYELQEVGFTTHKNLAINNKLKCKLDISSVMNNSIRIKELT